MTILQPFEPVKKATAPLAAKRAEAEAWLQKTRKQYEADAHAFEVGDTAVGPEELAHSEAEYERAKHDLNQIDAAVAVNERKVKADEEAKAAQAVREARGAAGREAAVAEKSARKFERLLKQLAKEKATIVSAAGKTYEALPAEDRKRLDLTPASISQGVDGAISLAMMQAGLIPPKDPSVLERDSTPVKIIERLQSQLEALPDVE